MIAALRLMGMRLMASTLHECHVLLIGVGCSGGFDKQWDKQKP